MPLLNGGVIVMLGMVASAGMNTLSVETMTRRKMIIIVISLTAGLGLFSVPSAVQYLADVWKILAISGLTQTAFLAIVLNPLIPEQDKTLPI